MADDLIDFSESEARENLYFDDQDENIPPCRAPDLAQSPVIVNSILKQCTKDNLIQLYTPVQKPVKGKLKVRFGSDSLLQTPVVKTDKSKVEQKVISTPERIEEENGKEEKPQQLTDEEEDWIERTSVLTKQDHAEYTEIATDIVHQLISEMPVKEEAEATNTADEEDEEMCPMEVSECQPQELAQCCPMDISECQPQAIPDIPSVSTEPEKELSLIEQLLQQAQDCLKDYGHSSPEKNVDEAEEEKSDIKTESEKNSQENGQTVLEMNREEEKVKVDDSVANVNLVEEEPMDCEEAMKVDDEPPIHTTEQVKSETCSNIEKTIEDQNEKTADGEIRETAGVEKSECVSDIDKNDQVSTADRFEDNTLDKEHTLDKTNPEEEPSNKNLELENEHVKEKESVEEKTNNESDADKRNEEVEHHANKAVRAEPEVNPSLTVKAKDDSSDEEFMSADEEVEEEKPTVNSGSEENKDVLVENTTTEAQSPERIPPKVGYSINFDDLDQVNPFASKSGLTNSPDVGISKKPDPEKSRCAEQEKIQESNDQETTSDKTEEKNNIDESVKEAQIVNAVEEKEEKFQSAKTSPEKDNTKPLTETPITEDVSNEQTEGSKSDQTPETQSPERIPPKVGYSLDFDDMDMMNPFATKSAIQNSPDIGQTKTKNNASKTDKDTRTKGEDTEEKREKVNESIKKDSSDPVPSADANLENDDQKAGGPIKQHDINKDDDVSMAPIMDMKKEPEDKTDNGNCDILDKDTLNPKSEIMNSPDKSTRNTTALDCDNLKTNSVENNLDEMEESRNDTSSVDKNVEVTEPCKMNKSVEGNSEKQKKMKMTKEPNSANEISEIEAPKNFDEEIPIAKGSYDLDSIDLDSVDPFRHKKQMMNSPDTGKAMPAESEDPFKTKNQLALSPPASCKDITKEIENETKKENEKQVLTESTTPNTECVTQDLIDETPLPDLEEIDPFKPGNQMQKSPLADKQAEPATLENLEEIDPFKPRKQMQNSPLADKQTEPANLDNLEEIDPFKPRKQMQNSPLADRQSEQANLDNLEEIDPFKPRKQMQNSPLAEKQAQSANLDILEEIDPFKPKKQMQNSPLADKQAQLTNHGDLEEIDPFKASTQICNSPVNQNKSEPVKDVADSNANDKESAENQTDSTDVTENVSPSQTKSKNVKSPNSPSKSQASVDAFEDLNPFKTACKVANSPQKDSKSDEKDDCLNGMDLDSVDPFKPRKQMTNSPSTDPFVTKSRIVQSPVAGQVQDSKPEQQNVTEESDSDQDIVYEIQGVARQGEQPEGTTVQQFGSCLNIDEQMFVPATEVFSAPGVWDMLEQFGSKDSGKEESSLSRMSLYVKFDPLVDAAPSNPRRISIRPAQLEKVKEYGLDETLLLLGTPPKKRRQSMNVSHLKHTPLGGRNTPTNKVVKSLAGEPVSSATGGVDLILEFSPNREIEQVDKATLPKKLFEPGLSLLSQASATQEDTGLFQELKYTDADLRQLRSESQLEFQGAMLAKQADWQKREEDLKKMIRAEQERTRAEGQKTERVKEEFAQMKEVVAMFEDTIKELADKKGSADKEKEKMKKERDQALQDILEVENAFSDLHRRYEKMKNILVSMKQNEEVLKKTVAEHLEKKKTMDSSFQSLKKKAEENISKLTQENKRLQNEKDEMKSTLEAKTQVLQLKLDSAEKKIEQKKEENKQLAEICDNLISKHEK